MVVVPCAACIVLAFTAGDAQPLDTSGVPVALVSDISLPDATMASPPTDPRVIAIVLDARRLGPLTDAARFRVRTVATDIRAARDTPIGLELVASQAVDPSVAALAAYVDFLVVPADLDRNAISTRLPLWTDASDVDGASALDLVTAPRIDDSEHVLVRVSSDRRGVLATVGELRDILPEGLTPLADVQVTCDRECDPRVYLNPQTLDAVAVVRPGAPVTRVTVRPAAESLSAFGGVRKNGAGAELDVPASAEPFVLLVHGWRRPTEEAFATGVDVTSARALTADEIVARHQAARGRQQRALQTVISTGSTVLTFQVPGFPGPLTVTARTTMFAGPDQTDIKQEEIRINGLDLVRHANDVPKLPLIEPERVTAPPLAILLNDAYEYALRGRERINGVDAYVISFTPRESQQTLLNGRAWIDARTFTLVRTDASQTALRGPIASSREVDEYESRDVSGTTVALIRRAEISQTYLGPISSTPIHRVVTFDRHEVNPVDYASRLDAAHKSDAVLLRDTPQGFRFLVPPSRSDAGDGRVVASSRDHVTTAVVGGLFDPNISVPLVFAGVSYVDFNLFGSGAQLNAFFGGTYGRLAWATRPLAGNRWRLSGDASGVAVTYNDRAFRGGVEHYDENLRQQPAQLSVAAVRTLASAVRLRTAYELTYTRYTRTDSTAENFLIPSSTPTHAVRVGIEAEHRAWNADAWVLAARRQWWTPWGLNPSSTQADAQVFERFGASIARPIIWSPRAVARVEVAWMSGHGLDRFSRFAFGTSENPLRGYPSVSIRYDTGAAARTVATWTPTAHVRLDAFADVGMAREPDAKARAYPGLGAALEVPAPLGWLLAAEWGYGMRGVNTNGTVGTHVVRVIGYKMF